MKIAAALTSMDAARTYTEVNSFTMGLQAGRQASPSTQNNFNTFFRSLTDSSPLLKTRDPSRQQSSRCEQITTKTPPAGDMDHDVLSTLTGEIIGKPVRLSSTNLQKPHPLREIPSQLSTQATITSRLVHYEKEEVYFSSTGTIATDDGRELTFSLDLSMQRIETETLEVSVNAGRMTQYLLDPLVLSFTGGPPAFSTASFLFDLDGDGSKDHVAGLQPGCGFLALDRNNDGIINNGMELFGPRSGDGFADLAAFDVDDNKWIDENDPIFQELSIWQKNDNGTDVLQSLKEAGVGAIHLAHAGTKFLLRGTDSACIGQVTANGIFLTADGEVRSLQEVELAVGENNQTKEDKSGLSRPALLDAMVSLRVIIAMQRMRARLLIAGHRQARRTSLFPEIPRLLGNPFLQEQQHVDQKPPESFFTTAGQNELPQKNTPAKTHLNRHGLWPDDDIIPPMLSLDEMRGFIRPKQSEREKNIPSLS